MDAHPERLLISALINLSDVLGAEHHGITPSHFHEFQTEYEWLLDRKIKYRVEPSPVDFQIAFPDFYVLKGYESLDAAVDAVRESHLKWGLTRAIREITTMVKEDCLLPALDHMAQKAMFMSQGFDTSNYLPSSLSDPSASLDWALYRGQCEQPPTAPFSHNALADITGGMSSGDVWIKAARLGQGKTWDLVNEAVTNMEAGKSVTIFSLEMSRRKMEYRIQTVLAHRYGYPFTFSQIGKGRGLDLQEYKEFLGEVKERCPGDYRVLDMTHGVVTPRTIGATLNRYPTDLAIVDYIQLMGSSSQSAEDWQNLQAISRELTQIAGRFQTPILCAAQINRDGDSNHWRPPRIKNLAGSDAIGRDATGCVTMKRYGKAVMAYSLEKNRDGEGQVLWFAKYDPEHGDFHEVTKAEADDLRDRFGDFDDYE